MRVTTAIWRARVITWERPWQAERSTHARSASPTHRVGGRRARRALHVGRVPARLSAATTRRRSSPADRTAGGDDRAFQRLSRWCRRTVSRACGIDGGASAFAPPISPKLDARRGPRSRLATLGSASSSSLQAWTLLEAYFLEDRARESAAGRPARFATGLMITGSSPNWSRPVSLDGRLPGGSRLRFTSRAAVSATKQSHARPAHLGAAMTREARWCVESRLLGPVKACRLPGATFD